MGRLRWGQMAKRTAALGCAVLLACALGGCRPTDFFTEVVISPFAEEVDWDNSDKTVVNSPDAQEESADLSALDWDDESNRSEEVQNLVVYSSNPTTTLTAHHSIYDERPLFSGIEASDGVRLEFAAEAALDEETVSPEDREEPQDAEAESTGGEESEDAEETPSAEAASGEQSNDEGPSTDESTSKGKADKDSKGGTDPDEGDDSGDGDSKNNSGDADSNRSGSGKGDDDNGTSDDDSGGNDGTIREYNPSDRLSEPQHADKMAVLGSQAAVLVQAIGGKGAICAMSRDAYTSKGSAAASTFKDVFADELSDGFASSVLLWSNDGSAKDGADLSDVDALVSACGQEGVIVYDQSMGDQTQLFSETQRRKIAGADIELVPVDLTSVDGIRDAAQAVGEVLSESGTRSHGQTSTEMAEAYRKAMTDIVTEAADVHGGVLAGTSSDPLSSYAGCPITGSMDSGVRAYVAVDSQISGLRYNGAGGFDVKLLLFANMDATSSPLMFWEQVGGACDGSRKSNYTKGTTYTALWPRLKIELLKQYLEGSTGVAYSAWNASTFVRNEDMTVTLDYRFAGSTDNGYGLGSRYVPYLIVCANSSGKTAAAVKQSVVADIGRGASSLYGANVFATSGADGEKTTIGWDGDNSDNVLTSASSKVDPSSVVRENPVGLVGEWTEGSMESVLESVWIAELYSHKPANCTYDNSAFDMNRFNVTIGRTACTDAEQTTRAFYSYFYRFDLDGDGVSYDDVVTDQFDGLVL